MTSEGPWEGQGREALFRLPLEAVYAMNGCQVSEVY